MKISTVTATAGLYICIALYTTTNAQQLPLDTQPVAPATADTSAAAPADAAASYDAIAVQGAATPAEAPVTRTPAWNAGIDEVVVTARRTAESQQDVPIAITAFSAETLVRESINTAQDLQGRVPSLVISSGAQTRTTETPVIRGQGATFGGGSGVLLYFAEAPMPADSTLNNVGGPGKFFDLENVQVLKGSQGTLFGRNTTGGAMLLTPTRPKDEFSGFINAQGSSLNGRTLEGAVNLPVVDDMLFMRLAAQYVERDGFTHDVANGTDYDNRHYGTARLGITFRPVDNVENYLFGYYTVSHDNGTGTVMAEVNSAALNELLMSQFGLSPLPLVPTQLQPGCVIWDTLLAKEASRCGQRFADEQNARDKRHVQLSADPTDQIWTGGAINSLSWNIDDELTLRNITSYSFLEHKYRFDHDGSRALWTDFATSGKDREADVGVFSEEVQLQGHAREGLLAYTTGFYFENQRPRGPETETIHALYNNVAFAFRVVKYSYGPFAQATYDLGDLVNPLDGVKFTAGVRYTFDKTKGESQTRQDAFGIPGQVKENADMINNSALTWTLGLDYKVIPETLLYGKVSRGYKSGGFAFTGVNPASLTYKPEFVINYEIGQKSDFKIGEVPLRLNAAAYYTDYTDIQRNGVDVYSDPDSASPTPTLGAAIFNAGRAYIQGIELEATVIPLRGLSLSANYAYTDAGYDEYDLVSGSAVRQLDCSGALQPQGATLDLACAPFQYAPRHQASATIAYDLPLDAHYGEVGASVTYSWTDTTYTSATTLPDAEPGAWLQAMGLLNAQVSWDHVAGSQFGLQLFGTNLMDKAYIISNENVWTTLGYHSYIYSEPRIVGARLSYRFGN